MPLPTEKTKPKSDLMAYSILLYGPTKVGKTTFAAAAPDTLILACEPGTNALEVYEVQIANWADMLQACAEIAKGDHKFRTIVIDTIDLAYVYCREHVCRQNGWKDPSDADYGKGFSMVNAEFRRVLLKLTQLPYGLMLISHSQDKEVKTKTATYMKVTTTLPESARKIVIGLMDLVLLAEIHAEARDDGGYEYRRIVRTKPTPAYDAGDRTGKLPEVLPLDYNAFAKAFATATAAPKGSKK